MVTMSEPLVQTEFCTLIKRDRPLMPRERHTDTGYGWEIFNSKKYSKICQISTVMALSQHVWGLELQPHNWRVKKS